MHDIIVILGLLACVVALVPLANRIAAAAQSPKLIVPNRSSAVIHASGAAGTMVRSRPSGMLPPKRFAKKSVVTARGHVPRPLIVTTSRVFAS